MAVPQRRTGKARKRKRRAHHAMVEVQRTRCTRCKAFTLPHSICENCGYYRGRALIQVEEI
ncbi:MAG: 50S ribosomal protein L32 [Planctomycetota bacterium]